MAVLGHAPAGTYPSKPPTISASTPAGGITDLGGLTGIEQN